MARSFNSSSGKKTFGVFSEPQEAGDYIYNKKAKTIYCSTNNCIPNISLGSESNYLLFNRYNQLTSYPFNNSINKTNLNINLITKMNLNNVPVIADLSNNSTPVTISTGALPYLTYNVDPCGNLFGNNVCGIDNYLDYLQYNGPNLNNSPYIINGTYTLSSDSNYNTIITFTSSNTNIVFTTNITVNYIIVGGGGGGGGGGGCENAPNLYQIGGAGGGGGGQVLTSNFSPVLYNPYFITIGEGGSGGSNSDNGRTQTDGLPGTASTITSTSIMITANGGLGGQRSEIYTENGNGGNSGSGGSGGIGQADSADVDGGSGTNGGGGGGGGQGSGQGGSGSTSTTLVYSYSNSFGAGGGGGGSFGGNSGNSYAGSGGVGSNDTKNDGNSATPNYGGGGGGGCGGNGTSAYSSGNGGNGGSGIVILYFNI